MAKSSSGPPQRELMTRNADTLFETVPQRVPPVNKGYLFTILRISGPGRLSSATPVSGIYHLGCSPSGMSCPLTPNAGYELATSGQLDGIPCDTELDGDEVFDMDFPDDPAVMFL